MFPFLRDSDHVPTPPPLPLLVGQTVIHTRVAPRATWTVTGRGWALRSRGQLLDGAAVGLRDPRAIGGRIQEAVVGTDGAIHLALAGPGGLSSLAAAPPWTVTGPHGAHLTADDSGRISARPPGDPEFATPAALAQHAASEPSGIELRLLRRAQDEHLHPGHVVEALMQAGAMEDKEFERRGPILLARMLAREELRAGFVTDGRFTAWELPLAEVVEHVGVTWAALGGREPTAGMIAWFELTQHGGDVLGPTGDMALGAGMSGYDSPGVVGGFR